MRKKIMVLLVVPIILVLGCMIVDSVSATVSYGVSYTNAFTGPSLNAINNVTGWGSGELELPTKDPELLDTTDTLHAAQDIVKYGNYLYCADYNGGILTYNVSDPANVFMLANYTPSGACRAVAIVGSVLYATFMNPNKLVTLDLSTPANPTYIDEISLSGPGLDLEVSADIAYCAVHTHGIQLVNVSDPFNLASIVTTSTSSEAQGLCLSGTRLFVAMQFGIQVFDVTTPGSPSAIGSGDFTGYENDIVISDDKGYISSELGGLIIINVSNPSSLVQLGEIYDSQAGITRVRDTVVVGNYAYCACSNDGGLFVIDVTNPSDLVVVGEYISYSGNSVVVDGNIAYLAEPMLGIMSFNASGLLTYAERAIAVESIFNGNEGSFIINATILVDETVVSDTHINYFLSPDNGVNYEQVYPGSLHTFTNQGTELEWMIEMLSNDSSVTPVLRSLNITFNYLPQLGPDLYSPENGSTNVSTYFTWESLVRFGLYTFQLDDNNDFSSPIVDTIVDTNPFYNYTGTLEDGIYYWRVSCEDSQGNPGLFSTAYFVIDTASSQNIGLGPAMVVITLAVMVSTIIATEMRRKRVWYA
ncbi:hypothetical protein GF325_12975 [Candidatus Bathyarchaeota archaeon]|nr:hypothetical protein [Candidatus Bathyarchaeota archaeon]